MSTILVCHIDTASFDPQVINITEYVFENGQLKDFTIDGKTLVSTSDDPWIVLDVSKFTSIKWLVINFIIPPTGVTQIFFTPNQTYFTEDRSVISSVKSGINYFSLPKNHYEKLRLDLTNVSGDTIQLSSIMLYNEIPFGIKQTEQVICLTSIFCVSLFFILFPEKRPKLLQIYKQIRTELLSNSSTSDLFRQNKPLYMRRAYMVFLIGFIVIGIFYSVFLIPLCTYATPDDMGHISYIQYIASGNGIPIYGVPLENSIGPGPGYWNTEGARGIKIDKEEFTSDTINWIVQHPPLYYLLNVPVYLAIKTLFDGSFIAILIALRLVAVAIGALVLLFIYKLCLLLKCTDIHTKCIMACFVISANVSFIFASVDNDCLVILICTISLYYLLKYKEKQRLRDFCLFVIMCSATMLTKYTGALVILPYIIYFIVYSLKFNGFKKTVKLALLALLIGGIMFGPWLIRCLRLYGGLLPRTESDITYNFGIIGFFHLRYFFLLTNAISATLGWKIWITATDAGVYINFLLVVGFMALMSIFLLKSYRQLILIIIFATIIMFVCIKILNPSSTPISVSIMVTSIAILFITQLMANDNRSVSRSLRFFWGILICVLLIFGYQEFHFVEATLSGQFYIRTVNGRYFYIALFPFLYVLTYGIRKLKSLTVALPVILSVFLILTEIVIIESAVTTWGNTLIGQLIK